MSGPEWDKVKDLVDKAVAGGAEAVLGGDDGRHGYDRYVRRKTVYLRYGG